MSTENSESTPALPWMLSEDKTRWTAPLPDGRTATIKRVLGNDGLSSHMFVPRVYESSLDFETGPACAGVMAAAQWAEKLAAGNAPAPAGQ